MKNDIKNHFLFPNSLTCLGDFLLGFSENSPFSVWVKDVNTKKHIMNNQICSDKWGLGHRGLEGMTTREVLERVKKFSNLEDELKRIEENEQEIITKRVQNVFPQVLLTHNGYISAQQTSLTPLFGTNNQLIAIVGIASDLTRYTNMLYLLTLYQQYYPKKQAVLKLSKYLTLERYFAEDLSCAELSVLLAMVREHRAQTIEASLKKYSPHLSPCRKTIANYIASLKDKLKPNIELILVLNALRDQNQWLPEFDIS